jgi:hypothetical protein
MAMTPIERMYQSAFVCSRKRQRCGSVQEILGEKRIPVFVYHRRPAVTRLPRVLLERAARLRARPGSACSFVGRLIAQVAAGCLESQCPVARLEEAVPARVLSALSDRAFAPIRRLIMMASNDTWSHQKRSYCVRSMWPL